MLRVTFPNTGPRQRLITPTAARRLGSVVSGDAHVCACVIRGEARDHLQCDAPRFCGIPSKWNIERQLIVAEEDSALTSIGSRKCDESLHLARGPNFEFHARSIGPYLRDGRSRSRSGHKRGTGPWPALEAQGTFPHSRPAETLCAQERLYHLAPRWSPTDQGWRRPTAPSPRQPGPRRPECARAPSP
jgi:hypothetical protein